MTEYLLSIDPGKSSGIALLSYDEDSVPVLEHSYQFGGGVNGVMDWTDGNMSLSVHDLDSEDDWVARSGWPGWVRFEAITEKFTARATKGFSYRTDALEPLRCEGALIALGIMPDYEVKEKRWLDPNHQYLVGGKDKADKKRRMHKFLKGSGFYVTGKQLDSPDADDARSAIAHGISYLARVKKHEPSYRLIAEWVERNPV